MTATPLDLSSLRHAIAGGASFKYRFFWGHRAPPGGRLSDSIFSQWWPCRFSVAGDPHVYTTAEQWMMAGKARLFGDDETLAKILAQDDPGKVKALGRKVRNFDDARWGAARFELVVRGNLAKFAHEGMKRYLLGTGEEILVEASPTDAIWGIGLAARDPRAKDPHEWPGKNLLGFALTRVKEELR